MSIYTNSGITVTSGYTSGITAFAATADTRNVNYDTYNWTPIQNIINLGIHIEDLPSLLPANKNVTRNILRRAMFLNKITKRRRLPGRDF